MIHIDNLQIFFGEGEDKLQALKGICLNVNKGESFGLVGESGSGKSTVLNCITGLLPHWTGQITIDNKLMSGKRDKEFYRKVQMVFQDPYASLHPRHTIDRILKEPVAIHGLGNSNARVKKILEEVGLDDKFRFRYPHQLSGGQRQRVAIARALILEPSVLLLDEPTSALDVSIQAEVLNLLLRVREQRNLTFLMVSHDLAVISHMCSGIAVMNHGSVIEILTRDQLCRGDVKTDYTSQLMTASKGYDRKAIDKFIDDF